MKNNARNTVFYEAAKLYIKASLELIISRLQSGEQVPYEIVEVYDFEKTESRMRFGTDYRAKRLYSQLVSRHKNELHSLPECQTCKRIMKSDPVMSKHIDTPLFLYNTSSSYPTETYLDYLLMRQLESTAEKPEFSLDRFDEAYRNLEVFFQSDKLIMRTIAPIHNFQCDADLVDLGDGLCIRRIKRTEQEQLLHEFKWSPSMSLDEILDLKYVIENSYEAEKIFNYSPTLRPEPVFRSGHGEINKLLIALRLFKSGAIGINTRKTFCASEIPLSIGGGSSYRSSPVSFTGERYALTSSEVQDFVGFWSKFKTVDLRKSAQLGIALRRFSYAYERESLEDKLIDLLVAFEALFFKKDELSELSHRLSTRVSRLLEQEYGKRKDVFKRMKVFYKTRSKVVHGEQVELEYGFIRTVEDYLRRSVKVFLEYSQMDFDEILTHLDLD